MLVIPERWQAEYAHRTTVWAVRDGAGCVTGPAAYGRLRSQVPVTAPAVPVICRCGRWSVPVRLPPAWEVCSMVDSTTTQGSPEGPDETGSDRSQTLVFESNGRKSLAVEPAASPLGLGLFFFYGLFYAAFVLTSAIWPDLMQWRPAGGLNLALLWGFSLIGLAIALAGLYGFQRRQRPGMGDRS
jgi:hypothetical protein